MLNEDGDENGALLHCLPRLTSQKVRPLFSKNNKCKIILASSLQNHIFQTCFKTQTEMSLFKKKSSVYLMWETSDLWYFVFKKMFDV